MFVVFVLAAVLAVSSLILPSPAMANNLGTKRIDMILYRGCEEACTAFLDWINNREIPVTIRQFDAALSAERLHAITREININKPDLVVTWGTTTALTVFGRLGETGDFVSSIPGVFMIVTAPEKTGLVESLQNPGRRLTGTIYLVPEKDQMEAIQTYIGTRRTTPRDTTDGVTNIGILYNGNEKNSRINVANMTSEAAEHGITVTALAVPVTGDGAPDPEQIDDMIAVLADAGIDLLYHPADSFLNVHREKVTEAATAHGIPVFAAGEAPVRSAGAMFGLIYRYKDVGIATAQLAERVLSGEDPSSIPISPPGRLTMLVNMAQVEKHGLLPPDDMLPYIEYVQQ